MNPERTAAIVIFSDGSFQFVGRLSMLSLFNAVTGLQRQLNGMSIGPEAAAAPEAVDKQEDE